MSKNVLSRQELKKHVGAVHIRNKLSLLQRKVANILLLNAYDDLLSRGLHTISVRQLAELAGFDSKDYQNLKAALIALTETAIEWNLLDNEGNDVWRVSSMLSEAEISRGICRYAYSRSLAEKLYHPEIYARINLAIQRRFSSGYALALYENCARFRGVGATGWWHMDMFRKLMGVEDSEYINFKYLNKRVIKPAVEQVNHQSDLHIGVNFRRAKRRVVALNFTVQDNPQLPLRLSVKEQIMTDMENEVVTANGTESAPTSTNKVRQRLVNFGLTEKAASDWLNKTNENYVVENLDIVERDFEAGKVRNLSAYTTAALQQDFRPRRAPIEEARTQRRAERAEAQAQRQVAQDRLSTLRAEFRRDEICNVLKNLSSDEREEIQREFFAKNQKNPMISKFRKYGMDHPVIRSVFLAFVCESMLDDLDGSSARARFAEFVRRQSADLVELEEAASA